MAWASQGFLNIGQPATYEVEGCSQDINNT